jgi:hypothetical protein
MAVLIFFFIVLEKSICEVYACLFKRIDFAVAALVDLRLFMAISEVFTSFGRIAPGPVG